MPELLIGKQYAEDLIESIKKADRFIKIFMYDWRLYPSQVGSLISKLNVEIFKAKRRGVDIQVVLNNNRITKILKDQKIKVHVTNVSKTMHAKLVIIDNKLLYIGSHNFSQNAFEINWEISLKIEDKKVIERCNDFFNSICLI